MDVIKLINKLLDSLLPFTCCLCNQPSDIQKDICQACLQDLPRLKNYCGQCANPLPETTVSAICGQCSQQTKFYDRVFALFQYQYPINTWIIALKFQHQLRYARLLGELYADFIKKLYKQQNLPEVIIPIPLHRYRLQERGFNQSIELARHIKNSFNIPIEYQACHRIRATETQSLLFGKKRFSNVKDAFLCQPYFTAKHVAIIDDVMTTGATVNALSKTLRENAVQQIDIWCIARATVSK